MIEKYLYHLHWDKVRQRQDQGGLGIKDLAVQNICLLLKLLHKLHWYRPVFLGEMGEAAFVPSYAESERGYPWRSLDHLRSLLPLYQAIATVPVGDSLLPLYQAITTQSL